MRHVNDSLRWMLVAGMLAFGTSVLGTSCLQVNTGHCMFAEGDFACDEAFCVGAVGGRSDAIAGASTEGCIATLPSEDPSWVHVEYGLPTATAAVEGIIARELEARGLTFDPSKAGCRERIEGLGDLAGIHDRLRREDLRRSSVRNITFSETERERITSFNADMAAALAQSEVECVLEPGTTETSTGPDVTTTEQTSSSTGPSSCTDHDECTDPDAPFCGVLGECGTCDGTDDPNGACADQDPTTPICDDGVCVQCTAENPSACTDDTPICDDATRACTGCTTHAQCGEAACNLFTGECLPADRIVHVGPGQRFTTLAAAVSSFEPEERGTLIVHPGPPNYDEAVLVAGGRVLAFLAADIGPGVEPPRWVRTSGTSPQLTVAASTTVLLDGLLLTLNGSNMVPGVRLDGGDVWIDRSRIVQNAGGGIVAEGSSELVLRNCFVGGDISDVNALLVNGATANISYTTVGAGFGAATALACDIAATVSARNSLFVARTDEDEVTCDATFDHSAAELDLGDTNVALGDMATTWFVS